MVGKRVAVLLHPNRNKNPGTFSHLRRCGSGSGAHPSRAPLPTPAFFGFPPSAVPHHTWAAVRVVRALCSWIAFFSASQPPCSN